ncbi:type IV pili methyl-accepting chemotaxis transducer N-terminal domain-containing protein [Fibrella sp. WM1]|uniref:ATP-binding protein n=1 Tax=Fibrella musci TaxID=3242485 RepID=UPI003521B3AB
MLTRLFTYRYILALSLIAGLTIWGQVLIQRQLDKQENDSWLINEAGRQRFRSQMIVKDVMLLLDAPVAANAQTARAQLNSTLNQWATYHQQLKSGNLTDRRAQSQNSAAIQGMFAALEPHFTAIQQEARRFTQPTLSPTDARSAVAIILQHDSAFLSQMDKIVQQYEAEASQKIAALRQTELLLLAITLLVLVLEAIFIFRPAVRALGQTLGQLTAAQENTQSMNHDLQQSNQALQDAQGKLLRESALRHQQQMNEQVVRMAALMQGQEEERRRLSHDLHDGLGQMLTGLKLLVENVRSVHLLPEKEQRAYANLKDLVIKTIQETRQISNNLMPPVLSDFGLEPALRQLVDQKVRQTGLTILIESEGDIGRLDPAVEIGLYRIAQEALNNAIKHADADEIDVLLQISGDNLLMTISDNGRGVAAAAPESILNGHGLHNMRERARLLNGVFRLASEVDRGTRVIVTIPLGTSPTPDAAVVRRAAVA